MKIKKYGKDLKFTPRLELVIVGAGSVLPKALYGPEANRKVNAWKDTQELIDNGFKVFHKLSHTSSVLLLSQEILVSEDSEDDIKLNKIISDWLTHYKVRKDLYLSRNGISKDKDVQNRLIYRLNKLKEFKDITLHIFP